MRVQTIIILSFVVGLGCSPYATPEDERFLAKIEEEFGDQFSFAFEWDGYLRAQSRLEHDVPRSVAESVYRSFFFDRDVRRANTKIAYVNFYSSGGAFLYQTYWDSDSSSPVFDLRHEHY